MKILLLILSFSYFCLGAPVVIDTSANNMGSAYNTTYPQLAIAGSGYGFHLGGSNTTANTVCCNTDDKSATVAPNHDTVCIPSNGLKMWDNLQILGNIYCRSVEGTSSTGKVILETW